MKLDHPLSAHHWQRLPIEKLTLFAVLAFGVFYLFVFPPNSAPDEAVHYVSAYQNANAVLGLKNADANHMPMRETDVKMTTDYSNYPDRHTYEYFRSELFQPLSEGDTDIVQAERITGVTHPYTYIPQTIGILLGRAFQANSVWVYLLGRIFSLIFYAVCVWLSIRITPVGKGVFAMVSLFPMAMELAASYSYDVYTTSLTFLALAQYLRIAYRDTVLPLRDRLIMLLTMAVLSPPKAIFISFMILAFFLPPKCFAHKKERLLFRLLTVGVFIATFFITIYIYTQMGSGDTPVINFMDQDIYTFSDLLADPLLFAKMCYRTIRIYFEFYLYSMIGGALGWLEIPIPKIVQNLFLIFGILSAFKNTAAEKTLQLRDRILFPLIFLIASFGTAVLMFVLWTPVGSWNIIGIQGRYFLPVCTMLILAAVRWGRIPPRPKWLSDKHLVLYACILEVIVLVCAHDFIAGREPLVPAL